MNDKELTPKKEGELESSREREHPFYSLQRRMNDLFEDFWRGWPMPSFDWPTFGGTRFVPKVNVSEKDGAIRVHAELPGLDEKDIQVTLTDEGLTLGGEKKSEKEEKDKHYLRREFSYGAFRRTIPLPPGVQADKVKATFKNGVLEIELPLPESARPKAKKIEVKRG